MLPGVLATSDNAYYVNSPQSIRNTQSRPSVPPDRRPSVQFSAVREQQLQGGNGALLDIGEIVTAAGIGIHRTYAGGRQRGRRAIVIGQIDDGAVFEQKLDGRSVLRLGGAKQRRHASNSLRTAQSTLWNVRLLLPTRK